MKSAVVAKNDMHQIVIFNVLCASEKKGEKFICWENAYIPYVGMLSADDLSSILTLRN